MKKRLLAMLISGAMLLSLVTPAAFAEEPEGESCGSCGAAVEYCECGGADESAACEVCGLVECECPPAEEPEQGAEQGAEEPAAPALCEVCNADPCTCEGVEEEEPALCETCQQEPCVCPPVEEPEVPACPGDDTCTIEGCENHAVPEVCEGCNEVECVCPTLYELLMAAESIMELFEIMMLEENYDALMELTTEEIEGISDYVQTLPCDTEGDEDYFAEVQDVLALLPNSAVPCEDCGLIGEHAEDCPWVLGEVYASSTIGAYEEWQGHINTTDKLTGEHTWTFNNSVLVLKNPVRIGSGATLTIQGNGSISRHSSNVKELLIVEDGGRLIVKGTSKQKPITFDGQYIAKNGNRSNVRASAPLISAPNSSTTVTSSLRFENTVIQNSKNRSVNAETNKPNATGGGLQVNGGNSLYMEGCVITRNTASVNAGGFYSAGPTTIIDTVISYNRAMSTETSDGAVNAGRGGGFYISGTGVEATFEGVTVSNNVCFYYGGGGQLSSGAKLTIDDETVFEYNEALLHGAGALHVTGDATFIMNGGIMRNNFAQTVGGAIHSSYTCVLELNAGEIKDNVANGRGGGININTGGSITLGAGLVIEGNKVYDEATGSAAEVDQYGEFIPGTIEKQGAHANNGYGGGLCLDSATCTVSGATISGNSAEVGGGAIALVMLNGTVASALPDIRVCEFEMTSGTISGNTSANDGAGVYMMSNRLEETLRNSYPATSDNPDVVTYDKAVEKLGEELLTAVPHASVSGGVIQNNIAENNGGGLYLDEDTSFEISGTASLSENEAVNGAGAYIARGTATIYGGTIEKNEATGNGGGLYVAGTVTMHDGNISENKATTNGGALYVEGPVTIYHGTLNKNSATDGGAIYMAGTANTLLTMESGTMNGNTATDDGGAIFATSGTLKIGLESCPGGEDQSKHTAKGSGRHHPLIQNNKAGDTGGGIALEGAGIIYLYCVNASLNKALYPGVGENVFMNGGELYYYNGAQVGESRDPDLVIVGGKLNNNSATEFVKILYYQTNADTETAMQGYASVGAVMNLPDGEYFWPTYAEANGKVFIGWTAQGAASGNQNNETVRNKEQYIASGSPIQVLDGETTEADETGKNTNKLYDGTPDKTMHLYGLWAPEVNQITYMDKLTGETISHGPATYTFDRNSNVIKIQPATHTDYDLVGWYIYQKAGENANWNNDSRDTTYEPVYSGEEELDYSKLKYIKLEKSNGETDFNGVLELEAGNSNFGPIVLIADFVPGYADLKIVKAGWNEIDANQTFLFKVVGTPVNTDLGEVEMMVAVEENGSVRINHLPVGTYTVTEEEDWSWRYSVSGVSSNATEVKVDGKLVGGEIYLGQGLKEITITNEREKELWLDGNNSCQNVFSGTANVLGEAILNGKDYKKDDEE